MRRELYVTNPKTVTCGKETISFLYPKMWALILENVKVSSSFTCFKKGFRK